MKGEAIGAGKIPYCILGLEGETLAEGQLRTTQNPGRFEEVFGIVTPLCLRLTTQQRHRIIRSPTLGSFI